MSKVTQIGARQCILSRKPFEGSNISAGWHETFWGTNEDLVYTVYSYNWYPIFLFSTIADKWFRTDSSYSKTTAKQMSRIFPYGDLDVKTVPHSMMEDLDRFGYQYVVEQRLNGARYA